MATERNKANPDDPVLVPEPREGRRTSFSYVLFSLLVTLLGIAVAVGGLLLYGQRQLEAAGPLTTPKSISVNSGQRGAEIAAMLESEGVISNRRIFYVAAAIYQKLGRTLKAGEYQFEPGASMQTVFDKISKGKAVAYKITIPEGWTTTQALQRIRDHPALTGDAPEALAEGVLLPDTYAFRRGDARQVVIDRMRKAQTKLLDELWSKRAANLPLKTVEEALILASIVEKETADATERARVAAVFTNRLNKNMRLQSDPTIIYGIVGGKGKLGRPIRKSEIDAKTAYNTYQIDGLPPTPIANPGRQAILAVLHPAETDELYFVANGTGGHAFSRTLAEHEVYVRRYRKIERQKKIAATSVQQGQVPEKLAEPAPFKTADESSDATESREQKAATTTIGGDEIPLVSSGSSLTGVQSPGEIGTISDSQVPLPRPKPAAN